MIHSHHIGELSRLDGTQGTIENPIFPGDAVTLARVPHSHGTVISVEFVTAQVLWSREQQDEDLRYFQKKLYEALRIPKEYISP